MEGSSWLMGQVVGCGSLNRMLAAIYVACRIGKVSKSYGRLHVLWWLAGERKPCTPSRSVNLTQFANERSSQEDFALKYIDTSINNNSHGKY